jgi:hypothetical protein
MSFSVEVESGNSVKLLTAGKYCDKNIVVTATGGGDTDAAYQQGFDAGKKEQYDMFWYLYQQAGSRTNYEGAFAGHGWTTSTFKPKYNIVPTDSFYMAFRKTSITDLYDSLQKAGVRMDISAVNNMQYAFYNSWLERICELDCSSVNNASVFNQCFASCTKLVTIDKLKLATTSGTFSSVFDNTPMLENIVIEGEINRNGLNFKSSTKLTHDSLMSIIGALADYSKDTSGTSWTLTLGATNLAKLTDAEKAIATEKGWSLV